MGYIFKEDSDWKQRKAGKEDPFKLRPIRNVEQSERDEFPSAKMMQNMSS